MKGKKARKNGVEMNQSTLNSYTFSLSHGVQAMITCGILSHISDAVNNLDKHDRHEQC
ncbi:MAG: hypothetical protein HXS48_00640 [Theionarchaea archaeon]|nr:hypothetical protein [Theionarchaea archaeon]